MPTATPITLSTVKSGMCFLGGQVPRPKNNLLVERAAGNPIGGGRHFDPPRDRSPLRHAPGAGIEMAAAVCPAALLEGLGDTPRPRKSEAYDQFLTRDANPALAGCRSAPAARANGMAAGWRRPSKTSAMTKSGGVLPKHKGQLQRRRSGCISNDPRVCSESRRRRGFISQSAGPRSGGRCG
jgi:hypothetical protein